MGTHKIKRRPFFQIILLIIILVNSGCPKPCLTSGNYSFNVNVQITPDKDSVQIGDTIFLISSFPDSLIDQSSGQLVEYNNSKGIGNTLSISIILPGDTLATGAVLNFDYLSINGKIYNNNTIPNPDQFQQITYQEFNKMYVLKVGLIAKKTGNYVFGLSDGVGINSGCSNASFNISINNTNQHFYLIQEWIPGDVLDDYGKRHVYYFKVY